MWWFIAIAYLIQATASSEGLIRRKRDLNPETHMNVSQKICHRGYPSEEYEVLTDDGYYLMMNRIPYGKKNTTVKGPKPVVLLQHGFLGEASHWVENMANNSLGFILADAGYDVWLGNNRGTSWSQRNQHFSADQDEFWDFSFHEMAMHDLPAMINFILKKTGQKQLYYVGYSQGSTLGFIAFSTVPELSQKIKMFFALAPVISVKHVLSPILRLLFSIPEDTVKRLLVREYFSFSHQPMRDSLTKFCSNELIKKICAQLIFSSGGFNASNINMSRVDVYAARYPDETSVKNIQHWKQLGESGLFRYFNYGSENQAKYNQSCPPTYKIENSIVPTAVWSGGNDLVADPEDMEILLPRITNLVYYQNVSDWNHWDFIWGLNAPQRMYYKITELMNRSL
ncbi:lipase member M-like [Hemicordylus capensis]|uniref:lipase member M-like n=1 Tax=Hemicordylus capensis TaxID=884348 RepID=UPI0023041CE5|nr:lipase member M-like [Hemicordylus capensis]